MLITRNELEKRLDRFYKKMDSSHRTWDTVFIISKVNQYYFTGTLQDGFLIIKKDGRAVYYVRRSYERAVDESGFRDIISIKSYRDAAEHMGSDCGETFFETDSVPYGTIEKLKKYFSFAGIHSADKAILSQRAVKSEYELDLIRRAGSGHKDFFDNILPYLFREGMSEAELFAEIYEKMLKHGSQSLSRCSSIQTEMSIGRVCFGESSIYPINMDSPDGGYGMSPAIPLIGSRERKLKKSDLIFVDLVYGIDGYHTDKTQVYMYKDSPSGDVKEVHDKCLDVLAHIGKMLRPGIIPSSIYADIMEGLDSDVINNFMGYGDNRVKFLGHGTGLCIDEYPVLSKGSDEIGRAHV